MHRHSTSRNQSRRSATCSQSQCVSIRESRRKSSNLEKAAILAQIAITALSLDNVTDCHWIVRGLFVTSLVHL